MGIAAGEVVLDKGGRPFIGAGLNLAARVMNLADGGQIFATAGVGDAAAAVSVPIASFGEFELKNIARPVEIVESPLERRPGAPRSPRHGHGARRFARRVEPRRAHQAEQRPGPGRVRPGPAFVCWSWRQELNPQPTDYKSVALPLSYASERAPVYAMVWRRVSGRCSLAHAEQSDQTQHELQRRICVSILRLTRCNALSTAFVCRPSVLAMSW